MNERAASILKCVDHTLLKPEATAQQIRTLCEEAITFHTASVCVNPCHVPLAFSLLRRTDVAVCTVIGFPLGASTSACKALEAAEAVKLGAQECDMVINIGALKEKNFRFVEDDIRTVREAIPHAVLKVIVETCLLSEAEKRSVCDIVCASGADFIKTSTGFSTGGATFEDVALFKECCKGRCKIKAAGGISSIADMEKFLALGADRLGTSRAIRLFQTENA